MAALELVGCFGLTEPAAGSDPASMLTTAARDGDEWVIDGVKRWIGLASIADVAVIWAKTTEGIRGFAVPTAVPGFTATPIEGKLGMRASIQCDITLTGVRLPADAVLPAVTGLKGPFSCLNEARYGIMWGAHGCGPRLLRGRTGLRLKAAPVRQADRGVPAHPGQAGRHDAGNPEGRAGRAAHRAGSKDAGTLRPEQISFGKLNNVREAIAICRQARTILGGNGITLDHSPVRHASNLESVRTYEGTDDVHILIMGRALTGQISAFS